MNNLILDKHIPVVSDITDKNLFTVPFLINLSCLPTNHQIIISVSHKARENAFCYNNMCHYKTATLIHNVLNLRHIYFTIFINSVLFLCYDMRVRGAFYYYCEILAWTQREIMHLVEFKLLISNDYWVWTFMFWASWNSHKQKSQSYTLLYKRNYWEEILSILNNRCS